MQLSLTDISLPCTAFVKTSRWSGLQFARLQSQLSWAEHEHHCGAGSSGAGLVCCISHRKDTGPQMAQVPARKEQPLALHQTVRQQLYSQCSSPNLLEILPRMRGQNGSQSQTQRTANEELLQQSRNWVFHSSAGLKDLRRDGENY